MIIQGLSHEELLNYANPVSDLENALFATAKELLEENSSFREAAAERELMLRIKDLEKSKPTESNPFPVVLTRDNFHQLKISTPNAQDKI